MQVDRLDAAAAPAAPLDEVSLQVLRRETHREALVQVTGLVALVEHGEGREQILGDRIVGEAADHVEGRAAGDRAGAAAEAHVPGIAARGHLVEEQPLLVGPDLFEREVRLDRILVEEVLRGLNDADRRIGEEGQRAAQEVAVGNEIRIEDCDEIAR